MTELQAEIILKLAENTFVISTVANQMYRHRNSITYHIERIRAETGKDPMTFYDMVELLEEAKKVLEVERVKVRYQLEREDLAALVAEKYGVKPEAVTVTAEQRWTGHGPMESVVHVPVAYFTKEE